jgi:hypothetical protein
MKYRRTIDCSERLRLSRGCIAGVLDR